MKFGTKYANRLISDTGMEEPKPIPGVKSTHLMKVDESRLKDFFGVDCTWYWSAEGEPTIIEAYTPSRNQEIAFIGLNEDDPNDLNAEITFSRDPYNQMGGYVKRCRGINCYIKVECRSTR